jgi:hypothetical protein
MENSSRILSTLFMTALAALALLVATCGQQVAGSATEAGNAQASIVSGFAQYDEIKITGEGASIESTWIANCDKNGNFVIYGAPENNYAIFCSDSDKKKAVLGLIKKEADTVIVKEPFVLSSQTVLKGRLIDPVDGTKVFIPGSGSAAVVDNEGFYTMPRAPAGRYDLTFLRGDSAYYLPVLLKSGQEDTAYVHDVTLSASQNTVVGYGFYKNISIKTSAISAVEYLPLKQPAWYKGKKFGGMEYFKVNSGAISSVKPIWRFSLIVGVSDKSVDEYGELSVVVDSIQRYFHAMEAYFNSPGVFAGIITLGIDSLYIYQGTGADQFNAPPDGYAMRYTFNTVETDESGWNSDIRVINQANMPGDENLSPFRDDEVRKYLWMVGQTLGMDDYSFTLVDADSNFINGDPYLLPATLLSYPWGTYDWHEWNVFCMNYFKGEVVDRSELYPRAFPARVGVRVLSPAGTPITGATITLYPVLYDGASNSTSVRDSLSINGVSDAGGLFLLSGNPYLKPSGNEYEVWNYLVKADSGGNVGYCWLPIIDIATAWFKNPDASFVKTITLSK